MEEVKEALNAIDICGITISQVMGCGRQKGLKEVYRGTEVQINILPKIKIETVVADDMVEKVVGAIIGAARMGEIGDGKIFVSNIEDAIRIRTGERGGSAL
jgi:nitrogen regulatory protein P-II 1